MNILVTGGCGFIGSNFIRHVLQHYATAYVSNVDILTYAGNPANLADVPGKYGERYEFYQADIASRPQIEALMRSLGMAMTPEDIGFTHQDAVDAFRAARDTRDKYLTSSMLWDMGVLLEMELPE